MTVEEKKEICSRVLITWILSEQQGVDLTKHDEDFANLFTSRVILKKFEVFNINIVLPDMLLFILNICVEGNPGQFQIVLKDLLNSIKKKKGPIPEGYIVTTDDFSMCFMTNFPIMSIPQINTKYESLWIGQKIQTENPFESDNLCDTPEWWKEVMK